MLLQIWFLRKLFESKADLEKLNNTYDFYSRKRSSTDFVLINYQAPYEAESITGRIVYPCQGFDSTVLFFCLCAEKGLFLLLRTEFVVDRPRLRRG